MTLALFTAVFVNQDPPGPSAMAAMSLDQKDAVECNLFEELVKICGIRTCQGLSKKY